MQIQDRLLHSCIRVDEVVPDVKRNVPAKSNDFFLCGGARWAESTLSVNRSLFFLLVGAVVRFKCSEHHVQSMTKPRWPLRTPRGSDRQT